MTTPSFELILNYMVERLKILKLKSAGEPAPWTKDPILQDYRFCNVYREDDTVTIWINEHIRKPFADHPDLWLMLALSRMINWPDTLAEMMSSPYWFGKPNFSLRGLAEVMQVRAERKEKVYTGAYMIRAESDKSTPHFSWTKHRYITEVVVGRLVERRAEFEELFAQPDITLQAIWTKLQEHYFTGWGPFMSYEVVTDLRHTRYLNKAPDIMTWANAGPGAIRGLNRLYGRPLGDQPKPTQTNNEMQILLADLLESGNFETLEMRDVEHNLCETDKYLRVLLKEGRPRSKYKAQIFSTTANLEQLTEV